MKNWPCQICYVNINSPYMQYCLFTDLWIHVSDLINTSWNWMVWVQIQTQEHVTILSRTNNNMFLLQFLCKSKWININMWGLWRHHARSLAAMRRLPLSPAVPPWCCSEKHYYFYMRCRDTHSTRHAQTHAARTHIVHVWFRCTCLCICTYSCTAHACNERSWEVSIDCVSVGHHACVDPCQTFSKTLSSCILMYS